jgi:hypothetical protein
MTPYSLAVDLFANGISAAEVAAVLRRMGISDSDASVAIAAAKRSAPAEIEESEPEGEHRAPPFEAPRWLRIALAVVSAIKGVGVLGSLLVIWMLLRLDDVSPMIWAAQLAQLASFLAFIGGTVAVWKRHAFSHELMISAAVLSACTCVCLFACDEPASFAVPFMMGSALAAYFKEWWSQRYG